MEAAVFILSLVDCCALIFLSVYFIITLSDLECDYINARACCSKLNKWVIPEMVAQCLSTMLMLVSMHWFILLLNLPVAAWNIYRYAHPVSASVRSTTATRSQRFETGSSVCFCQYLVTQSFSYCLHQ
uniref:Cornichon family AMPA receptor auxiliary protein 4 n=1 Tax=Pundamilia nyererei TaxID=303518 RepID=A0A3B4FSP6_9CICH